MSEPAAMTVGAAIRAAAERLSETSDTARLDAELLMAHAMGVSRSHMLLQSMGDTPPPRFSELIARRAKHEPLAYIVGMQEFYGREFVVSKDTLIPRADSETLIDVALKLVPAPRRTLDLGTGTGALLITVVAERGGEGVGIDSSTKAIRVADENAHRIGVSTHLRLMTRNWNQPGWSKKLGQFDLVLCNPPYVESTADLAPSVAHFEPSEALYAGVDGLDEYRSIIPQLAAILAPAGTAIFEIGHKQAEQVTAIAASNGFSCEILRDLAGRPRAAILTRGVGKVNESV